MHAAPSSPGVHPLPQSHRGPDPRRQDRSCHPRQLCRSQAPQSGRVAGTPSAFRLSLHPHIGLLAQCRRGLLRHPHQASAQARRLQKHRRPSDRDQSIPRRAQPGPKAIYMDQRCRHDHRRRQTRTPSVRFAPLASLYAAGYLPEIWTPDAGTERMRRLAARRYQVVRHRTRIKNEVHAILHAHLIARCPHADLFNGAGRAWLARQPLPADEREAIERHVRELDRLGEDLEMLDKEIAASSLDDASIARLITITGVNLTVAAGIVAAIGDIGRFSSPQKLVSYFGLNPRVRQSGLGAAHHGRISKAGRSHARAMLVEAAWAAAKAPGPLHAFFVRIRAKRGHQVAAVALARKLTVLCWHLLTRQTSYRWARPALVAAKRRAMELQAGQPQKKGNKRGPAYVYNIKALRDQEMNVARHAEQAYEQFVAQWETRPNKVRGRLKPEGL